MFKVGSTTTTAQTPGIPPEMNEQDADLKNTEVCFEDIPQYCTVKSGF